MTGPEHYAEAERLLQSMSTTLPKRDAELPGMAVGLQLAQVHATLALAAAQPEPQLTSGGDPLLYVGIGKTELDRLRGMLKHSERDRLTAWEVVEIAADEWDHERTVNSS